MELFKSLRKGAGILVACLFALAVLFVPLKALAKEALPEAAAVENVCGDEALGIRSVAESHDPPPVDYDFSIIRVLITTGNLTSIWLDLCSEYTISGSSQTYSGTVNAPYPIAITRYDSTKVVITNRETEDVLAFGSSLTISRVNPLYQAGYAKLTRSGSSNTLDRMYLGNFDFRINSSGYVQMVNIVPMAYYLYGVVGYEMAPGCADAALIAQAITAKSFALYYVDVSASSTWDVQDGYTSSQYQGYRGFKENRLATMPHCLAAVGLAITYQGTFVPTCYAHSDGGETALPSHVFGSSRFDDAYSVSIDDIEFDNDYDTVCRVNVTFGGTGDNTRFRDFILTMINGYYGAGATKLRSIQELYCLDPVEETQRNMQRLHVKAKVKTANGDLTYAFECPTSYLKSYPLTDVDGSGDSYSSNRYVFGENYLIFWGKTKSNGYELYFARYGHGLGLSQIGANTRGNSTYNQTYQQILAFYFPKFQLVQINEVGPDGTGNPQPIDPGPGPGPEPPADIRAYGECIENGTNFRSGPGSSYSILGTLMAGEHLDILDVTADGWYQAIWNGITGYIIMTYSRITQFPSPADGVFMLRDGEAMTRANLRSEPYINTRNIITKMPAGTRMVSWAQINKWHYVVTEDGLQGFTSNVVVSFGEPYEYLGMSCVQIRSIEYQFADKPCLPPDAPSNKE